MKPRTRLRALRSYVVPVGMLLAGAAALATGLLPWPAFEELTDRTVPVLGFVVAMSLVTELVDDAGLFRAVTDRLAALGRGRVRLLWLLVIALATVSTVFLSLDTTAVLVTPVVVLLAVHARIPPLPFALTTIWLANTASLLLPVSNLTNLLAQGRLGLSPAGFAALVWAPALAGVLLPLALLWLAFRKELRGRYSPQPAHRVRDQVLLYASAGLMLLLLPALVSGIPVYIPAAAAAGVLLALFLWRRRSTLRWSMVPWRPLMLTVGLFMVVETLHANGLAKALAGVAGSGDSLPALLQLAGLGAGAANAVNNLPAYLALEPVGGSPLRLAALLIGVNFGPLVTPGRRWRHCSGTNACARSTSRSAGAASRWPDWSPSSSPSRWQSRRCGWSTACPETLRPDHCDVRRQGRLQPSPRLRHAGRSARAPRYYLRCPGSRRPSPYCRLPAWG